MPTVITSANIDGKCKNEVLLIYCFDVHIQWKIESVALYTGIHDKIVPEKAASSVVRIDIDYLINLDQFFKSNIFLCF